MSLPTTHRSQPTITLSDVLFHRLEGDIDYLLQCKMGTCAAGLITLRVDEVMQAYGAGASASLRPVEEFCERYRIDAADAVYIHDRTLTFC
jgi:hypothetical protein